MNWLSQITEAIRNVLTWWVVLAPWESGVRVRLGKHMTRLDAGLHLRIPFVDRVCVQSVRKRMTTIPLQTLRTSDGQTIAIAIAFGYSVLSVERLFMSLHDARATITNMAMAAVAEYVSTHTLAECEPGSIRTSVSGSLRLYRYGLGDTEIVVTDFVVAPRAIRLFNDHRWDLGDELRTYAQEKDPSPFVVG